MKSIRGMVLPLPTVFNDDGSIDVPLMEQLTDYYIEAGVNALFVGGSFGQGPALAQEERKQLAELVLRRARARVPVMVHAGTADPYTAIDLGKHALSHGADALGFVGPYYYSDHTPAEVRAHFKAIGRELRAPIMVYNNPKYQGYPIGPDLMAQLRADTPHLFGAKLAMGGAFEARLYADVVGEDFSLFALSSSLFPGMLVGIAGTISPPLACFPEIGVELVRAIDRDDVERSVELQAAVVGFESALMNEEVRRVCGRTIFREGLRTIGFDVKKYPRWPTGEFPSERREWLAGVYERARKALGAVPA
jgi:dihydrodipicolinate synthase/N-acetylneuraminate lyase